MTKSTKQALTPEREALAGAIAAYTEASAALDRGRQAMAGAQGLAHEAEQRLAAASEALEAQRTASANRIVEAALAGGPHPADTARREARIAHAEAQDDAQETARVLADLEAQLPVLQETYTRAEREMRNAAADVMFAALPALRDRIAGALHEAHTFRRVVEFLSGASSSVTAMADERLRGATMMASNFAEIPGGPNPAIEEDKWRAAFADLLRDATTPLPRIIAE